MRSYAMIISVFGYFILLHSMQFQAVAQDFNCKILYEQTLKTSNQQLSNQRVSTINEQTSLSNPSSTSFEYIELKNLVVLYKQTNKGTLHPEVETKINDALDHITNFYFRNSGFRLLLKWDIKVVNEYVGINNSDDEWTNVGMLQTDLMNRGIVSNQYDCVIIFTPNCGNGFYGATRLFGTTGLIQLCWLGEFWAEGAGIHEYDHFIDNMFDFHNYSDYPTNHPGWARQIGEFIPSTGHLDEGIVRSIAPERWLTLATSQWGELKTTNDMDSDQVPDNDPNLPFDEYRLNGNPNSSDTDGDNLSDFNEVLAGINKGSLLNNKDTDNDGLPDGEDDFPLYPVKDDTYYITTEGTDAFESWPLNGKYFDFHPDDNANTEFRSTFDDDFLHLGFKIANVNTGDVKLYIDGKSDGQFNGSDNFEIRFNRYGIQEVLFKDANVFDGNDYITTNLPNSTFPFNAKVTSNAIYYKISIPKDELKGISLSVHDKIGIKLFVLGYGNNWDGFDWGAAMFEHEDLFYLNLERGLIVNAKGSEAGGINAHFSVYANEFKIGESIASSTYQNYIFTVPSEVGSLDEISIIFDNDAVINGQDRNLYVKSIMAFESAYEAPGPVVKYVRKDGLEINYTGVMQWNGALTFDIETINTCEENIFLSSQAEINNFHCTGLIQSLIISGDDIVDLSPLNLVNAVSISIIDNPVLEYVMGFENTTQLYELNISNNPKLKKILGFSSLKEMTGSHIFNAQLTIENNPQLQSLDGFSSLFICNNMTLKDNPSLISIDGLSGLATTWMDNLKIENNDALTNVDALSGIEVYSSISVSNNDNLNYCCAFYEAITSDYHPSVYIQDNGVGCTEPQIVNGGICQENELKVVAKGSEAGGVFAHFKVLIDDIEIGNSFSSSAFQEYSFPLPFIPLKVDVVFDNDNIINGKDRNLYVKGIDMKNVFYSAPGENVNYIRKDGQLINYTGVMPWNGKLDFILERDSPCNEYVTLSSQAEVNAFNCTDLLQNLTISGNDIVDLSPLNMEFVVSVSIINNSSLENLNGLNKLRRVKELIIANNPNLKTIGGLLSLEETTASDYKSGQLVIENNPKLASIVGFSSLYASNKFTLKDNPSLVNIDGLSGYQGSFLIDVRIENNDALSNLDALSGMLVANSIVVLDNENLNHCCGLYDAITSDYKPIILISGNGSECTESQIAFGGTCQKAELKVMAKGSQAGGIYAHFKVLNDVQEVGDIFTTATYQDYSFQLPTLPDKISIVFDNDQVIDGKDRNLYVQGIEIDNVFYPAPSEDVTYIRKDGQVLNYTGVMPWNGILNFNLSVSNARHAGITETDRDINLLDNSASTLIYPNPNNGQFQVKLMDFPIGPIELKLFDYSGKLVENQQLDFNLDSDRIVNFCYPYHGVYLLKIIGENKIIDKKVIIL